MRCARGVASDSSAVEAEAEAVSSASLAASVGELVFFRFLGVLSEGEAGVCGGVDGNGIGTSGGVGERGGLARAEKEMGSGEGEESAIAARLASTDESDPAERWLPTTEGSLSTEVISTEVISTEVISTSSLWTSTTSCLGTLLSLPLVEWWAPSYST